MKKIMVLGAISLNGHQQTRLAAHGDLKFHQQLPSNRAALLELLEDVNIALLYEVPLDSDLLKAARHLEMISLWSAGFDNVDLKAARELGITVCHAPGCSATAIAEHTIAAAIYFTHRLAEADRHVRAGGYSWEAFNTPELRGQTFGIIGLGRIGTRVAEYALALGCRVIAYTRRPSPERAAALDLAFVELKTLLRESDIISLNIALTPETAGLIGQKEFAQMERRPILINTARGKVVDQTALLTALERGQIRAAALDVLCEEPPDVNEPLLKLENVLLTPHSAGSSRQAFECLSELCVQNVEAFLAGKPQYVITLSTTCA
ncbi:MAG: glycerate dehydrogenase [Chloroflexota bacterium]|nr:MAG: glycerate dehydrogenase [Chloroflexota bacterium]